MKYLLIILFLLNSHLRLNARELTTSGKLLIKKYEGNKTVKINNVSWSIGYADPATHGKPYTAGYGHTGGVILGKLYSQKQADLWFILDSKKFTNYVTKQIPITTSDTLFDMAVSGTYNFGYLIKGNLRNCFWDASNNYFFLSKKWLNYCHAAGKVNKGLLKRRINEEKHGGIYRA